MALLAGVSVEYYTRIERGRAGSVSDDVIDGRRAQHAADAAALKASSTQIVKSFRIG